MAAKAGGSLLAMLSPSDASGAGKKSAVPSPAAGAPPASPEMGPPEEDVMAAQDVLSAIKSRDPSAVAESLRAFIDMG